MATPSRTLARHASNTNPNQISAVYWPQACAAGQPFSPPAGVDAWLRAPGTHRSRPAPGRRSRAAQAALPRRQLRTGGSALRPARPRARRHHGQRHGRRRQEHAQGTQPRDRRPRVSGSIRERWDRCGNQMSDAPRHRRDRLDGVEAHEVTQLTGRFPHRTSRRSSSRK